MMTDLSNQEARLAAEKLHELKQQDYDNPGISPLLMLVILKKILIVLVIVGIFFFAR